ncbi:MAG: hypothetical protein CL881_03800 [Dehalococcoidia bacterium]|nr:hypothetical protein [Dehalococcoidia bacterium]
MTHIKLKNINKAASRNHTLFSYNLSKHDAVGSPKQRDIEIKLRNPIKPSTNVAAVFKYINDVINSWFSVTDAKIANGSINKWYKWTQLACTCVNRGLILRYTKHNTNFSPENSRIC